MATLKRKTNNGYEPLPAMVVRKTNAENGNGIGTCSTSSGTALTVSLTGYELVQNGIVAVTFENDVPANATLNINSKGAKPIYYKGSAIEADVIKADDTVMFCYDGTNYVVTSLGGGGGTGPVVYPEFVTIQLTSTEGNSDSSLIGASIVVTDDDTSETIASTTWQGSDIAVPVDAGVDYTVTVGNVTGRIIRPNYQSYTAVSGLTRTITFEYIGDFVDLGLPSGTLWRTRNVGASMPEQIGYYFSWGNIIGHNLNKQVIDYNFSSTDYESTPGYLLTAGFTSGDTDYDGASAILGNGWRTPTGAEIDELFNNTNKVQFTLNGVAGFKLTSTINSNYIFWPCTGDYAQGTLDDADRAYIRATDKYLCGLYPSGSDVATQNNTWEPGRSRGMTIRPVI